MIPIQYLLGAQKEIKNLQLESGSTKPLSIWDTFTPKEAINLLYNFFQLVAKL